jgi:DcuC family C4-dicarboxylate transporter
MTTFASLLVIVVAVVAILRRAEVRLTLLLAALALGWLAGQPEAILEAFLRYFTSEQFLLPIGCCMGFAHVLRHTGCDQHLVHLLLRPLRRARLLLVPGIALVALLVNVPIISQSSTAVAVGSVLVPVLRAANLSPTTTGAALALGASMGGELLNPGAPELRTVSEAVSERVRPTASIACIERIWPLLIVHLFVTVPLFWLLCLRAEKPPSEGAGAIASSRVNLFNSAVSPAPHATTSPPMDDPFRVNLFKALVPIIPLALLFLTALPAPLRALEVPRHWLVDPEKGGSFDSRLIGAAMLVGVVVAALTAPRKAGATARVFFEGAGYALANVTSLIVCANCFGRGVEVTGLAKNLDALIASAPGMLMPLASALSLGFAWVSGSGMASTQSLFGFFVAPAVSADVDPLRVGAVVSLSAAAGRTLSPVAAVVLMAASLTGADPLQMVRRMAVPLLAGVAALVVAAHVL